MKETENNRFNLEISVQIAEHMAAQCESYEKLWNYFRLAAQEYLSQWKPFESTEDLEIQLDLTLCDDDEIQTLNNRHRQKDSVTDVLSFPIHEDLRKEASSLPDLKYLGLGDVFICVPQGIRQAQEHDVDDNSELLHLLTHGFLHLLGYDHEISDSEAEVMQAEEQKIIKMIIAHKG